MGKANTNSEPPTGPRVTPAANDYIEIAFRGTGRSQNHNIIGLLMANGTTYGAGNQVLFYFSANENLWALNNHTGYNTLVTFAGVGCPFAADVIEPGDAVLDVGSGSGTDILFAALKVGPKGSVTGVDMTPAMLAKARKNIDRAGARNVKVVEGNATAIPVASPKILSLL